MVGDERWKQNWRVVCPADAVRVDLPRSAAKRRASMRAVGELPAGTAVVLVASAPGAKRRCTSFAMDARIEVEREYLTLPSAKAPAYLIEDAPAPVRLFVNSILVAPTRSALSMPIDAGLRLLRMLNASRLVGVLAPGRLVVGRRT